MLFSALSLSGVSAARPAGSSHSAARGAVRVVRARPNAANSSSFAAQRMERIVISGRMAEVCAELERMTAACA